MGLLPIEDPLPLHLSNLRQVSSLRLLLTRWSPSQREAPHGVAQWLLWKTLQRSGVLHSNRYQTVELHRDLHEDELGLSTRPNVWPAQRAQQLSTGYESRRATLPALCSAPAASI